LATLKVIHFRGEKVTQPGHFINLPFSAASGGAR
jgi:hypothetical protein